MQQGLAFCNICFKTDQHYSYKIYSINSKIELNGEEEEQNNNENEILKQEIENVQQIKSGSMGSDDVFFIPKVSEETLEKRVNLYIILRKEELTNCIIGTEKEWKISI